jgi:hypothetical protein
LLAIYRRQIILLAIFGLGVFGLYAQPNLEQYDLKRVHFGFTLAANSGRLLLDMKSDFQKDTIRNVSVKNFPGIGLGAITNIRLSDYWDVRLMVPVISFVQRNLVYDFPSGSKEVKIESAYCDGSLLVKYKSMRRKNTRVYVIAGGRASYDFATTIKKNRGLQTPVVSLVPFSYGWEAGFGLDMYFEYFKFSPEVKICNSFGNVMYRDGYIYTNIIESISPQLIQISLHFE